MGNLDAKHANLLTVRNMVPRFLKALVKIAIAYFCFTVFSMIAALVQSFQSFQMGLTAFFGVYVFFIFAIEITRGTIYQHMFAIASSLALVVYSSCLLSTSVVSLQVEQVSLVVNLQFFFYVLLFGGVLGLVKSMLQLLNWINEKEECELNLQVKSL